VNFKVTIGIEQLAFKAWGKFVEEHPNGNIFQTPYFYDVYNKTDKYTPVVIACFRKEILVGILQAVIQKEYKGLLGGLSARAIIFGGPLVKDNNIEVFREIITSYNKFIRKQVIYSQFRNLFETKHFRQDFERNKFVSEDHLNIIVDLKLDEEKLWKNVHSKRRNEIRKAYKESAVFEIEQNSNALKSTYNILHEVYGRAQLPFPEYDFFVNLFNTSTEKSKLLILVAKFQNKIIGCMLALAYKSTIYDFYAGSYSKFNKKHPNDLIPWELFKWGKKNGYSIFDFGGAGKPDIPYGVREYKKKFGGEIVNFGRYEKIHNPFLYFIAKQGFAIWKKIQSFK